jgi:hypothetical protein
MLHEQSISLAAIVGGTFQRLVNPADAKIKDRSEGCSAGESTGKKAVTICPAIE